MFALDFNHFDSSSENNLFKAALLFPSNGAVMKL